MPIKFPCPSCRSVLRLASAALAGKKSRCPKCKALITVPAPDPEAAAEEAALEALRGDDPATSAADEPARDEAPDQAAADTGWGWTGAQPPAKPASRPAAVPEGWGGMGDDGAPLPPSGKRARPGRNPVVTALLAAAAGFVLICAIGIGVIAWLFREPSHDDKARDQNVQETIDPNWPDQWVQDRVYQVPDGGLTVTSRLRPTDARSPYAPNPPCKVFRVRLSAGFDYSLNMTRRDHFTFHPVLVLEGLTGKPLAFRDNPLSPEPRNARVEFQCARDGDYKVIATHRGGDESGEFTFQVTKKPAPIHQFPPAGTLTLTARVAAADEMFAADRFQYPQKAFRVRMNAGNTYTLRLAGKDGPNVLSPGLRVEDDAGQILATFKDPAASGPDARTARLDFRCPQAGVYRVVATVRERWQHADLTLHVTERDGTPIVTQPRLVVRGQQAVAAVALSPHGSLLSWVEDADGEFRVWDVKNNQNKMDDLDPALGQAGWRAVAVRDEGSLVLGGSKGALKAVGVARPSVKNVKVHADAVGHLVALPNFKVVSASADKTIKLWDPDTGAVLKTVTLPHAPHQVACSADGRLAAVLAGPASVPTLWDLDAGKEHATRLPPDARGDCLALSPDGKTLATGGADGAIVLWDTASGARGKTLSGHRTGVRGLCFSGGGYTLASAGGADRMARTWDVLTGQPLAVFEAHTQDVLSVALTANGKVLATGGKDQAVAVWDVPAAK
jgi:WD40 repeat protein